jgi:hypothetical protein
VFEKLSEGLSEQTRDSSISLNGIRLLKYVLNCEQHFSFAILQSGLADIAINCHRITETTRIPTLVNVSILQDWLPSSEYSH